MTVAKSLPNKAQLNSTPKLPLSKVCLNRLNQLKGVFVYLGVDQSYTSCAYVVSDDSLNVVAFGTITSDKNLDIYSRALHIAKKLVDISMQYKIHTLRIEGLAFAMRGNATRDLAGLLFTIRTVFALDCGNVRIYEIAPTSVKKSATGSGKADKSDMIAALPESVRDRFVSAGFKKTRGLPDLADAYYISIFDTPVDK